MVVGNQRVNIIIRRISKNEGTAIALALFS
jgi:hypothetical protein